MKSAAPALPVLVGVPGKAVGDQGKLPAAAVEGQIAGLDQRVLHVGRQHGKVFGIKGGKLEHYRQFPDILLTSAPQAWSFSSSVSNPRSR